MTGTAAGEPAPEEGIDEDALSRQLAVYGVAGQAKIKRSHVLVSGMGALGIEIAKNLCLAGVRAVTIHDTTDATPADLNGNFYLSPADVGANRASGTLAKLKVLNPQVTVAARTDELAELAGVTVLVATEMRLEQQLKLNAVCRAQGIRFIAAEVRGVFGSCFVDFGDEFVTSDPNGMPVIQCMLSNISRGSPCQLTTVEEGVDPKTGKMQYKRHELYDGDTITLSGVNGLRADEADEQSPIEAVELAVKVVDPHNLTVDFDTSELSAYIGGASITEVKQPVPIGFQPLQANVSAPVFMMANSPDEDKQWNTAYSQAALHLGFRALHQFIESEGRLPGPWCQADADAVVQIAREINGEDGEVDLAGGLAARPIELLALTSSGVLAPLSAVLGGYVAQEALKAVMDKYTPLQQYVYMACEEVVPVDLAQPSLEYDPVEFQPHDGQTDAQVVCIGRDTCAKLAELNLFMIGAGAIGCELIKNLAMLRCCTRGKLLVTDPDSIEKSNLNRQFLFTYNDISQNKSTTAIKAVQAMYPQMQAESLTDLVAPSTEDKFHADFWDAQDCFLNALDNVKARAYVDQRCAAAHKPLIDSGTTGTKGHTQVVVPLLTETWGDQKDPDVEMGIPECTVKFWPSVIAHTISWAKQQLELRFFSAPVEINKLLSGDFSENVANSKGKDAANLLKTLKMLKKLLVNRPADYADCCRLARTKFEKQFNHRIRQLLIAHPADKMETFKDQQGNECQKPFWSLPRRLPTAIEFDPADSAHVDYVIAYAMLLYRLWKMPEPAEWSHEDKQAQARAVVAEMQPEPFDDNKVDLNKFKEGVSANDLKKADKAKFDGSQMADLAALTQELAEMLAEGGDGLQFLEDEFEKDHDSNYHIAFITAASNMRARCYSIKEETFLQTKLIAGKIIPAIATTTTVVSAAVIIELIKIVQQRPLESFKTLYLDLALPVLTHYTPKQPIQKMVLARPSSSKDDSAWQEVSGCLPYTAWDRWEVREGDLTIRALIEHFKAFYGLLVWSVFWHGQAVLEGLGESEVFTGATKKAALKELAAVIDRKLTEVLQQAADEDAEGADAEDAQGPFEESEPLELLITFRTPSGDVVKETPKVVVHLSEAARVEGFSQRAVLLEKRLALQDEVVAQLKEALAAKPEVPVWNPVQIVLYEGEHPTPASIALEGMLCELGMAYSKEPQSKDGPVLDQDGLTFWDMKSAITHIANVSAIPSWYPQEVEARTRCHEALFLHEKWLTPYLIETILAPSMGWRDEVSDDERSKACAELRQVAWPRIQSLLERSGGPLLGGAYPSMGDLVVGIALTAAQLRLPTLDIWTSQVSQYTKTLKVKLRQWAEYMARQEVVFGGYCLQAQLPEGQGTVEDTDQATVGQLLDKLAELSGLAVDDMAIKCGGGILGCRAVVLLGYPDCKLEPGYDCDLKLIDLGVHHNDVILVRSIASLEADDGANTCGPCGPPLLTRTTTGNRAVCPVCSKVFEMHNIQGHIEMHLEGSEDGQSDAPAGQLVRTYTRHILEEVPQITKIDMDEAGHVFFPFKDDEPRDEAHIEQEIAYLVEGLPKKNLSGGAMFVARDVKRQYYLKCMVIGPEETPYESGCFEFDIALPPNYPKSPPKVQLVTTGRGAVRFNANMYANGKVCLSLLGTHSGGLPWDPKSSTLLQVVESIAWCIMIGNEVPRHPWFNEPGYADGYEQTGKLTELAQALSATYNREIRRCTIKICMIDQIKYPPLGFEDAIREHFSAKGDAILAKVREWEAEDTEDDFQDIYQLRQEAIVAYSSEQLQGVLNKMVSLREKMRDDSDIPEEPAVQNVTVEEVSEEDYITLSWTHPKEKLGIKFHNNSYMIYTVSKNVGKKKFMLQRQFKWLCQINGRSVFEAPLKENMNEVYKNTRPLELTFTTEEEYLRIRPADYQEVSAPVEDDTIEAEFDKDIAKAQERLAQMKEAETHSLEQEAETFITRVDKLRALLEEDIGDLNDEEVYSPEPEAPEDRDPESEPIFLWYFSTVDCEAAPESEQVQEWGEFDMDSSAYLEEMFAEDSASPGFEIDIGGQTYVIDLAGMTQTNTESGTKRWIKREQKPVLDKEAEEAALQESLATLLAVTGGQYPEDVLLALLKHHPAKDNLDAVMNALFAPDFNGMLWLQKSSQADSVAQSLAGLPRSQVVEEWVCWCGANQPVATNVCSICQQPRQPTAKIVPRRATTAEVLNRLSDKVTPYKEAVEEARQLCFLLQAPAVVWEYVPPGQNKWHSFERDDIAKIERWCQQGGEPNIEVKLPGQGKYIVDMEQLRMQKFNPGMGFQGGNTIQPVTLPPCTPADICAGPPAGNGLAHD